VLGPGRAIEDGKDLLTLLAILTGPIEASIDQRLGRNVHHVVFADEIGFESDKPVVLAGE
jgi:hypothetical protein